MMTVDLGITREGFALAIATQNLLWGASSPFFGGLADRFGARKIIFLGGLLYGGGLLLMSNAVGMTGIMTGQALLGLGMGGAGISIVLGPVGRAVPPEKRSMALGLVTAGGSFGQFVMVPATQSLISQYGWAEALFMLAVFAAIAIWIFSLGLGDSIDGYAVALDDAGKPDSVGRPSLRQVDDPGRA